MGDLHMNFERIKYIREENEMTQEDVANILKVERSTYTGWETGKDTIPLTRLNDFCNYFNVSMDYVTGLTDNEACKYKISDIDIKIVSTNLRKIRQDNNLTQKDIFDYLNTTSSTYSAYETGKVLIKTSFVYSIAKKYNYSIDWIVGKEKKL